MKIVASTTLLAAAAAHADPSPVDAAQSAVLACHADYVRQVLGHRKEAGLGFEGFGFTATELAHGSNAACKPQLDAYARAVREAAGPVDIDARVEAKVRELRDYAFDYTIDAIIKTWP
jgi:hypothetical protein